MLIVSSHTQEEEEELRRWHCDVMQYVVRHDGTEPQGSIRMHSAQQEALKEVIESQSQSADRPACSFTVTLLHDVFHRALTASETSPGVCIGTLVASYTQQRTKLSQLIETLPAFRAPLLH